MSNLPMTLPSGQLVSHVEALAQRLGVRLTYLPVRGDDDAANQAESRLDDRHTFIAEPTDRMRYFIALHELGHQATTPVHIVKDQHNVIGYEANATRWAHDHAILAWDDETTDLVHALCTYIDAGYTLPEDPDNGLWQLWPQGSPTLARFEAAAQRAADRDAYHVDGWAWQDGPSFNPFDDLFGPNGLFDSSDADD